MEMTVGQRLKKILKFYGGQSAVAKKIGVNHSTLSMISKDAANPSYRVIAALLDSYPTINARWWLLGSGSMWNEKDSDDSTLALLEEPEQYYAKLKRSVVANDGSIEAVKLEYLIDIIKTKDEAIEAQKTTIQTLREQVDNLKKTA